MSDIYKINLSPYAKIFYIEWLLNPSSYRYNIVIDQTLHGYLDVERLRVALSRYVAEHILLNSHIKNIHGEPFWVKNDNIVELECCNNIDKTILLRYAMKGFDLYNGPLYRFKLLRINNNTFRFIIVFHHIVLDGRSLNAGLFKTLSNYYNDKNYPIQYNLDVQLRAIKNLAFKLSAKMEENKNEYKSFWKNNLFNVDNVDLRFLKLNRSGTEPNTTVINNPIEEFNFNYGERELVKLRQISNQYLITPYIYGQCVFALLLNRYTGQEQLAINYPVAILEGINFIYGAQVNINIIPYCFNLNTTVVNLFDQALKFFKSLKYENINYDYYPITNIIQESNKSLLDVCFVQTNLRNTAFSFVGITTVIISTELYIDSVTNSMLLFEQEIKNNKLNYKVRYDKTSMDRNLISNFIDTYKRFFLEILEELCGNINKSIYAYNLLNELDRYNIVNNWNQTTKEYTKNKCVHELFEEIVETNRDRVIASSEERQLTYEALNKRANQLGHYLKKHYVALETLVGIIVPKGLNFIIGVLGILKSGAAYVPIDSEYPKERLDYMLKDAGIRILLTTTKLKEQFAEYKITVICIDMEEYLKESTANLNTKILPNNLAYIIYTSGSMGTPKGTAIRHDALFNHMQWMLCNYFTNNEEPVLLQRTSCGFDGSVWEIFAPILSKGKLVFVSENVLKDIHITADLIEKNTINTIHLVPTMAKAMVSENRLGIVNSCLKRIFLGGEVLDRQLVKRLNSNNKNILVSNLYGPTEATIDTTHYVCVYKSCERVKNIPIGRPIDNTRVYILDKYLNPLPIGCIGELYIGGVGLARGYLNKPALTAEKFIPNMFTENIGDKGSRLYKTGDLGRYLKDGNIEFLGRIDHQIKIRGFRVELGEIEFSIQRIKWIKQCIVIAIEEIENHKKLVAYITIDKNILSKQVKCSKEQTKKVSKFKQKNEETIMLINKCRETCKSKLPDYMQPSQIMVLETLPLTPNGKVDRKALPTPDAREGLNEYETPIGLLEEQLANIWKEILKTEKIGRNDNFFHLGGHSLLAIQLISRIRNNQKVEVPLRVVFDHPMLKNLARVIEGEYFTKVLLPPMHPTEEEIIPLSFAQQRLWFLEQLLPDLGLYHIPMVLRLTGYLNKDVLIKSLNTIVKRHEILRTKIVSIDGVAHQEVLGIGFNLRIEKLKTSEEPDQLEEYLLDKIKKETTKPFNFNNETLFKGLLLELINTQHKKQKGNEHVLILTFHHIISDGWSSGIFNRELIAYYEDYLNNKTPKLPELPIQYKDYSVWQRKWLQGEVLDKQLIYWKKQLYEASTLALPSKLRPKEQSYRGKYYEQHISKETLNRLNQLAKERNVTLFMILLASFKGMLSRVCNQNDIIIGTPVANRKTSEIEQLIGCFVNTLVLRTDCSNNPTFKELIKRVEKISLEAYEHQDVSFEQLVDHLNIHRDLSRQPLFQVMFILQNAEERETKSNNSRFGELNLSYMRTKEMLSKFDLTLNVVETREGLYVGYEYASDLFDEWHIQRLNNYYIRFIEYILNNPNVHLSEVPILSETELAQLAKWNDTQRKYPKNKCVHELFEKVVENNKDRIAVVYENQQLTYEVLNERANQLGHYLKKSQIIPETLVGISVPRTLDLIIGLLGILKSGGVYIPLDPEYPKERVEYMLKDANIKVLLTTTNLKEQFNGSKGFIRKIICLDKADYLNESTANLNTKMLSDNLAYVIYTSGSTGRPKGVGVKHSALYNFMNSMKNIINISCFSNFLSITTVNFDISILELLLPMVSSSALVFVNKLYIQDATVINNIIAKHCISIIQATPTWWDMIASYNKENLFNVKQILCGGELLNKELIVKLLRYEIDILNLYGPTESTIWSVFNKNVYSHLNRFIIGTPIYNTKIYILDEYLNPVPIGSIGEIYIGGAGLARGYLNRPSLTAERFIPNPFVEYQKTYESKDTGNKKISLEYGSELYKTGDLGKYLEDGNIEFLGRVDYQVKIRGFRIELGEIESTIQGVPGIKQSVVLVREDIKTQKRLVGYVVPDNNIISSDNNTLKDSEITNKLINKCREECKFKLPDYMQPSQILILDNLPLTANGKIDRNALPAPQGREGLDEYEKPVGRLEEQLANIWTEILKIEKIGRNDNFFNLGGHSLLVPILISKVRKIFNSEALLSDFMKNPIFKNFCKYISVLKNKKKNILVNIKNGSDDQAGPLYLVHEGMGTIMPYYNLIKHIDNSIYAIEDPSFGEIKSMFSSLEEMARYYADLITVEHNKKYLNKPLNLGGWSFGGLVAFEIANILNAKNIKINNLVLFDTTTRCFNKFITYDNNRPVNNRLVILDRNIKLGEKYNLSKTYDSDIVLIKAMKRDAVVVAAEKLANTNDYYWSKHAKKATVYEVSGEHNTLFDKQNINSVGIILRQIFSPSIKK